MLLALSTGTSSHPRNTLQQRKFKIKNVLLLHLLIPGVFMSSLKAINPWLSACDISHPLQPELQGTCSAFSPRQLHKKMVRQFTGKLSCPRSCSLNLSPFSPPSSDHHCLAYLDENQKKAICNFSKSTGKEWLITFLGQIRLRHCCEHRIIESLSSILLERVLRGKEECFRVIDNLVNVDNLAARVSCEFTEVLSRFDCNHSYSVRFSCEDCKEAYRRWVCSTLVPYFNGTQRVRPCRSICQVVEQKCPYFLPENRAPSLPTQYAGEPAFLCVDPNIPESGEQESKSMYPKEDTCCMKQCGLPYEGICVSQGANCGGRYVYDNITRGECSATESNLIRLSNSDRCPGPSVFPGSKISGMPSITSNPFLLVIFTFLTLHVSYFNSHHHLFFLLLFFLVLFLQSSSFGILQLLACSYFVYFPPSIGFVEMKASYRSVKMSETIFNNFEFDSRTWEYYFTLISVNLRNGRGLLPGIPSSQSPQVRERFSRVRGEKIRGRCIGISMRAQKMMKGKFLELTENEKPVFDRLVAEAPKTDQCHIGIMYNGGPIARMETCSVMILKVTLQALHYRSVQGERRELCNALIKQCIYMDHSITSVDVSVLLILMSTPYIRNHIVCNAIWVFPDISNSYKCVCHHLKKYHHVDNRSREQKGEEVANGILRGSGSNRCIGVFLTQSDDVNME